MNKVDSDFKKMIQDTKFLSLIQKTEKMELVSFLAQLPLPVAIFDRESRFLGLNQNFADIYESDALYLNGKLLKSVSILVYHQFLDVIPLFENGKNENDSEFYSKGHFYLSYYKALRNQDGELVAVVVVCADITRLKRRENVLLLNNKKLHDHLYLDTVTGLPNKIAFGQFLIDPENLELLTQRISFLKIDLDGFKKFNQFNSYTCGDKVLEKVAEILTAELSKDNAKLFRMTSANFVVMMFDVTEWAVLTVAERLKCAISQQNLGLGDESTEPLTACIGVVHKAAHTMLSEDELLQKMGSAVQQAKLQGSNTIYVMPEESSAKGECFESLDDANNDSS